MMGLGRWASGKYSLKNKTPKKKSQLLLWRIFKVQEVVEEHFGKATGWFWGSLRCILNCKTHIPSYLKNKIYVHPWGSSFFKKKIQEIAQPPIFGILETWTLKKWYPEPKKPICPLSIQLGDRDSQQNRGPRARTRHLPSAAWRLPRSGFSSGNTEVSSSRRSSRRTHHQNFRTFSMSLSGNSGGNHVFFKGCRRCLYTKTCFLSGGFKYFLFSSLFGEDSQFD